MRRFIEESFPVKEVGIESAREKNIRHGHISTLHIWWARRPLASSRATNYAALIPAPENVEEWHKTREFIINFSKWENSLDQTMIQKAREDILKANGGTPPKVLDPFGGGGAIPLEALRLGCETYSNDLNPVAVLIQKCTLEYPQKYGKKVMVGQAFSLSKQLFKDESFNTREINPLLEDVKKWGNWVLEEAKKEIGKFYPQEPDGSIPVGYIWARTIPCQNPSCVSYSSNNRQDACSTTQIPLMRQFWLAKKDNKKISMFPYVEMVGQTSCLSKKLSFKIVGDGYEKMPDGFDPENGTVARAVATCPVCGSVVDAKTTRRLFQEGKAGQRMVAAVLHHSKRKGKTYRIATETDMEIFREAEEYLQKKREKLMAEWGMDPVPNEIIPLMSGVFNVPIYGINCWGDLFNSRQKLALITFVEKVKKVNRKLKDEGFEEEYAKAVMSYLALILSRHSSYNANLCWWEPIGERCFNVFGRQALPMVFDFSEQNPFGPLTGNWSTQTDITTEIISDLSMVNIVPNTSVKAFFLGTTGVSLAGDSRDGRTTSHATVTHASATVLPYENNFFDAVFTDPPYYNNVPYADLSDFFYIWLKRTVGDLYPELFSTPLTPKTNEIVELAGWDKERYAYKDKTFFENNLKKSFQEIHRVLKPDGIAVIVYAHKSTEGWETLINSLLDSGLIMTGAWPLSTEMASRLRANESAALASSIYSQTNQVFEICSPII